MSTDNTVHCSSYNVYCAYNSKAVLVGPTLSHKTESGQISSKHSMEVYLFFIAVKIG